MDTPPTAHGLAKAGRQLPYLLEGCSRVGVVGDVFRRGSRPRDEGARLFHGRDTRVAADRPQRAPRHLEGITAPDRVDPRSRVVSDSGPRDEALSPRRTALPPGDDRPPPDGF